MEDKSTQDPTSQTQSLSTKPSIEDYSIGDTNDLKLGNIQAGNDNNGVQTNATNTSEQKNPSSASDLAELQLKEMRNSSAPVVKTVMAETRFTTDPKAFSMEHWIEFQDILKSNYFVIKNESQTKEKILEEMNGLITEYNNLHLSIRDNNDRIFSRLNREDARDEDIKRVILDDKSHGLSDAVIFVKKLLNLIFEKPKIIALLVKSFPELGASKAFEDTLCSTFYEDIIADEVYDDDLIRLLADLLEIEFQRAQKIGDLFHPTLFANKVLASYLRRNECKRYVKSILRNPIVAAIKEPYRIRLDDKVIQKELEERMSRRQTSNIDAKSSVSSRGSVLSSSVPDLKKKEPMMNLTSSPLRLPDQSEDIPIPKFRSKKLTKSSINEPEEVKKNDKDFELVIEGPESPLTRIENRDVVRVLERNFTLIKKHLSNLIQSIFDNLHNMPTGLRILCKVIDMLSKSKFSDLPEKELNKVVVNYLIIKWIVPSFLSPEHSGILDDFQSTEEEKRKNTNNLMEISQVLQAIFYGNLYPPDDIRSELNDFIKKILPSVNEYLKELVEVNEEFVQQIRSGKSHSSRKIKSRSICISIYEIHMICEGISKTKAELQAFCPEAVNLAEKILFYHRESKILSEKPNPQNPSQKLKPSQAFVLFSEIRFPEHLISQYLEEFNKVQVYGKDASEEFKLLCRAKHLLKNFLLNIEDIKNMMRLSVDGKITLIDVLERYQDKIYSHEAKHSSKDKTPLHISARYLLSILGQLDKSYTENNFQKLYQEMFHDFRVLAAHLDESISSTKLQLLKALDTLKRNCVALYDVNEKKRKAIKKTGIRDFIKKIQIKLCVTSPSSMKSLASQAQKGNPKKASTVPDKIELTVRDEQGCIHERFAIIRELAANNGVLSGIPMGGVNASKETKDIFNEKNYHCNNIDEFIAIFGDLPEVKEAIATGEDNYGVNDAITFYYNKIHSAAKVAFKNVADEEYTMIMDEIENYICKRLYTKVFPISETPLDQQFWRRCKVFDWVNYDHLEIIPRNRCDKMWQYAAGLLNQMDNRLTPLEKLECMVECFKTITQVIDLASSKEGGGGADDTLPIMIYVLLKACPKRIHSNLNFIAMLRDKDKMLAGEGYCYIQVRSAVMTLESLKHKFFKMTEEEFNRIVHQKEIEHQILLKTK